MTPSVLSWLSHSESERRRALEVVDLFSEEGTRDELGIGRIRDAFSERLFPGTSTIQTRAGYFLFVPWIYRDLERRRVSSADIARRARRSEVRLIDALAESDDPEGTIGIQARGTLERFPSQIYWGGLGTWGIRRFQGHRGQYHASLDRFYAALDRFGDSEIDEAEGRAPANWHTGLPDPPPDFPSRASFSLRSRDAEYLQDRIFSTDQTSLLAHLVDGVEADIEVEHPWEHPVRSNLPSAVLRVLRHARNFSESIHGAALLYNLMLAGRSREEGLKDADLEQEYRERLELWVTKMRERGGALRSWDRDDFWSLVTQMEDRVGPRTHSFVSDWLTLVLEEAAPGRVVDSSEARELIVERERSLKGGKARLPREHRRELELWGGDSGSDQLDYRWKASVEQIVRDIQKGLAREDRRAAGR